MSEPKKKGKSGTGNAGKASAVEKKKPHEGANSSVFGEIPEGRRQIFATIAYVDESVAKVGAEHSAEFISVKSSIEQVSLGLSRLEQKVDAQSKQVDDRFKQVDERFNRVDERFKQVDERFKQVDKRFDQLDRKIDDRIENLAMLVNQGFLDQDRKWTAAFAAQRSELKDLIDALDAKSNAKLQEMYTRLDAKYHDSRILAEEQNSRSLLLLEKLGIMTDSHVKLENRVSALELR